MQRSAFYARAATDAAFRQAQLDDLRYFQKLGAGLMWASVAFGIAAAVYGGLTSGRWFLGSGFWTVAAVSASTYTLCRERRAALNALDASAALAVREPAR